MKKYAKIMAGMLLLLIIVAAVFAAVVLLLCEPTPDADFGLTMLWTRSLGLALLWLAYKIYKLLIII